MKMKMYYVLVGAVQYNGHKSNSEPVAPNPSGPPAKASQERTQVQIMQTMQRKQTLEVQHAQVWTNIHGYHNVIHFSPAVIPGLADTGGMAPPASYRIFGSVRGHVSPVCYIYVCN